MPFREFPGVTICRFKKGDYLFRIGEPVEFVYYLIQGSVCREITTKLGKEIIVSVKKSDNLVHSIVGVFEIFVVSDDEPMVCHSDFIANSNCLCYKIPKDICLSYIRQRPHLLEELVRLSFSEYMQLYEIFQTKEEGKVANALCQFLIDKSIEVENAYIVPKKIKNIEIAKTLSIHKVTVSRIIQILKDEGIIEKGPEGIRIKNINQLKLYADGKADLKYRYIEKQTKTPKD